MHYQQHKPAFWGRKRPTHTSAAGTRSCPREFGVSWRSQEPCLHQNTQQCSDSSDGEATGSRAGGSIAGHRACQWLVSFSIPCHGRGSQGRGQRTKPHEESPARAWPLWHPPAQPTAACKAKSVCHSTCLWMDKAQTHGDSQGHQDKQSIPGHWHSMEQQQLKFQDQDERRLAETNLFLAPSTLGPFFGILLSPKESYTRPYMD